MLKEQTSTVASCEATFGNSSYVITVVTGHKVNSDRAYAPGDTLNYFERQKKDGTGVVYIDAVCLETTTPEPSASPVEVPVTATPPVTPPTQPVAPTPTMSVDEAAELSVSATVAVTRAMFKAKLPQRYAEKGFSESLIGAIIVANVKAVLERV